MRVSNPFALSILCGFGLGLALVAALACGSSDPGSGDGDGGPDGDGSTEPPIPDERSCDTTFSFKPTGDVARVEVAGEWDDWAVRTELADSDGDGTFSVAMPLAAGIHAYKLIVTDGGGGESWILDPANSYRKYDGGVENSAARVGDCTQPELVIASFDQAADGATARIAFVRGNGGPNPDPASIDATLVSGFAPQRVGAELSGNRIELSARGLGPGKYTLRIEAADTAGRAAEPFLVPFWVEDEAFDWRDTPIYMLMVDRFRNGNPGNDPGTTFGADPGAQFFGGDLAGVTAEIEAGTFDQLGVRALWLSPFVENTTRFHFEETGHGITAFHGYWPVRAREIDPRLGTADEMEAMVAAAHAHGIRILMDFVINHVHEDHEYYGAHPEWFRSGCVCGTPGCDWTGQRLECLFHEYMPDVNWQNLEASEQMIADAMWWLERYDLDGFRVDAVKHVEDLAVTNLSTRVHERFESAGTDYFLLGETAMGWRGHSVEANLPEYETISRYIGPYALDGQFDFVLYHASAYRVWANDDFGMPHVDFWTRTSLEQYPDDAIMTPFLGSHDSERFLSLAQYTANSPIVHREFADQGPLPAAPGNAEPYERARVAFSWLLTVPGAPLVYYGDEYGEYGGADPDNRHMWRADADRSDGERAMFDVVRAVGTARRESRALRRGAYTPLTVTEPFLSFARHTADDVAVVALNFGESPATETISLPDSVPASASLVDALDPARPPITSRSFSITLPPRTAAILVPGN